ncbi:MAG: low affinity iron permease family protein [Caulobacteraceae bacterium]|nr:low affinity iron permease family protein [Caulobacteraceae bacterium]
MKPATRAFTKFAGAVSKWTGRPLAFILCLTLVVLWAVSGPLFGFSDTWQLVINTTTTIVTFLMVFLIQNSQNRDSAAIQAFEHLSDEELENILKRVERNAEKLHAERRKGTKAHA